MDKTNKTSALLITTCASFLTPFMASSINLALPSIAREFSMDAILLSWVSNAYILAAAIFLVPIGRIADIYGRKKIFIQGILIFTLFSFLSGMATSHWMLIAARVLQGVGASMTFGTALAILTSVFPPGERGKALGINVTCVYLGLSLGPFIGGFLTEHAGWRSIFLVMVPMGSFVLGLISWKLKGEWAGARGEKFDLLGSILYGLTLAAVMYGFSLLPGTVGGALIFLGIGGLGAFIKWEEKTESPVLNLDLFRSNRVFAFSNLASLVHYSATFGVSFLLSLYLQYVKGFSPSHAGAILVCQPAMQALFSPYAGHLSDRIEPRVVASLGMGFSVLGLSLLAFLGQDTTLGFIIASLLLLGFGFALFSSPNTNAIMSSVDKKFYGVSSGTLATMRLVGQMLSMGMAMLLFAVYLGRVQITATSYPLFLKSARTAFTIFAILCIGGIFASLARGKVRRGEVQIL
jgi:EmrB/QacA subfamily drug resistance transporter